MSSLRPKISCSTTTPGQGPGVAGTARWAGNVPLATGYRMSVTSGTVSVERLAQERIVPGEVGVQLEQIRHLVTEEREHDRPAAHPGHPVAGGRCDMDRRHVPMPVTVYVDQVRAEGAVGHLRQLAVVGQDSVGALVVAGSRALTRHVLND